jgi:hypothetical protein
MQKYMYAITQSLASDENGSWCPSAWLQINHGDYRTNFSPLGWVVSVKISSCKFTLCIFLLLEGVGPSKRVDKPRWRAWQTQPETRSAANTLRAVWCWFLHDFALKLMWVIHIDTIEIVAIVSLYRAGNMIEGIAKSVTPLSIFADSSCFSCQKPLWGVFLSIQRYRRVNRIKNRCTECQSSTKGAAEALQWPKVRNEKSENRQT